MRTFMLFPGAGSSSGLGAETAVLFASLGASVTLTGRNEQNLQKVATKCLESGSEDKKVRFFLIHSNHIFGAMQ